MGARPTSICPVCAAVTVGCNRLLGGRSGPRGRRTPDRCPLHHWPRGPHGAPTAPPTAGTAANASREPPWHESGPWFTSPRAHERCRPESQERHVAARRETARGPGREGARARASGAWGSGTHHSQTQTLDDLRLGSRANGKPNSQARTPNFLFPAQRVAVQPRALLAPWVRKQPG
jgi:hypothetical protein